MSTGPTPYYSNIPPWPIFLDELEKRGKRPQAEKVKQALVRVHGPNWRHKYGM